MKIKIAVDATNIKAGGGLSHLKQISKNIKENEEFDIHFFGGSWLKEIDAFNKNIFDKEFSSIFRQEIFKLFKLPGLLGNSDIVFAPGGAYCSKKHQYVTMCRNMLVFDEIERNRFPISFTWLRYHILERIQVRSFKHASGIIYISEYAKSYVENKYPFLKEKKSTVIYHGISDNFRQKPKLQKAINFYSKENPFKILYVSIINYYKHQWKVVDAVKKLIAKGYPIELELVGPVYSPLKTKMEHVLKGTEGYIKFRGKISYEEIASCYKKADMFLFASTCENMPNILVEAMSAGLPILCSKYGPMPEILKDGGVYMDPINKDSISENLEKLICNPQLREEIANKSYNYSKNFSWDITTSKTFNFIKTIIEEN
jgi:glycosyltransferase involved in cell wall biosynthesis